MKKKLIVLVCALFLASTFQNTEAAISGQDSSTTGQSRRGMRAQAGEGLQRRQGRRAQRRAHRRERRGERKAHRHAGHRGSHAGKSASSQK